MDKRMASGLENKVTSPACVSGQKGFAGRAGGPSRCPYCGAVISDYGGEPLQAKVHTRAFSVCGESCRQALELYVEQDKRLKRFFYYGLLLVAGLILAGSLIQNASLLLFSGVVVMGINLVLFPYPITSFETFFACPIRRVTFICRVLGIGFFMFGLFFIVMNVWGNMG